MLEQFNVNGKIKAIADAEEANAYVFTIEGVESSRKTWFHLLVSQDKYEACQNAINSGEAVNLKDYGTIIESGWGDPPNLEGPFLPDNGF